FTVRLTPPPTSHTLLPYTTLFRSIPFTAVATDLTNHKEVWFQSGSLSQAVRASAAIPSLLSPVAYNGRLLVDGAVLNPLPITPCVSAHADFIMAVDINADLPQPMELLQQSED